MVEKVKVSVIIPTYNSVKYVTEAIDSVLAQTYENIEIFVIDDGSTDTTREVLQKYGDAIHYLYKENGGASSARNYGIENATGKYIAFLDADDIWMPEKVEKQVALMESNEDIGLCYVSTQRVSENLEFTGVIEAKEFEDYCEALLLNSNIVSGSCSSAMVRRDVVSQTKGFDKRLGTCGDWEYWLRLSFVTKFAPLREELAKYRDVEGSMSSNPYTSGKCSFRVLNSFFSSSKLPEKYKKIKNKALSNCFMVSSGEFLQNGNLIESFKYMWKGLNLYPRNISRPLGLPFRHFKRLLTKRLKTNKDMQ